MLQGARWEAVCPISHVHSNYTIGYMWRKYFSDHAGTHAAQTKIQEHTCNFALSVALFLTKSWQFFGVREQLNSAQKWYSEVNQSCFEKKPQSITKQIICSSFLQLLKVSCISSYLTFQQNGHWSQRGAHGKHQQQPLALRAVSSMMVGVL